MSAILLSLGVQIEHFTFSETPQSTRARAHVLHDPASTSFVSNVLRASFFAALSSFSSWVSRLSH